MTFRTMSIAVVVYLSALTGPAVVAQEQASSAAPSELSLEFGRAEDAERNLVAKQTAEDMVVMGQILDEAMGAFYYPSQIRITGATAPEGGRKVVVLSDTGLHEMVLNSPGRDRIDAGHSAYLEGYGVVCQLTVPPVAEEPKKEKPDAATSPEHLTRWEATRRRVLGTSDDLAKTRNEDLNVEPGGLTIVADSIQFTPAGALPTRTRLIEKLLELLAENGHNFRHLTPEERLTVALTFREEKASAGSMPSGMGMGMGGMETDAMMGGADSGGGMGTMGAAMGGMMGSMMGAAMGGDGLSGMYGGMEDADGSAGMEYGRGTILADPDWTAGDLHLRQGNYKKAVEAYEQVIRNKVHTDPYTQQPTGPLMVTAYQKLAQAQVGAGEYAKAQKLIEAIESAGPKYAYASPEKRGPRFPAQLVISVQKGDLDEMAAGKVTFEEFKKRATTRYVAAGGPEGASNDASQQAMPSYR